MLKIDLVSHPVYAEEVVNIYIHTQAGTSTHTHTHTHMFVRVFARGVRVIKWTR